MVYDVDISWLFLFDSALDISFVSLCAVKISDSREGTWVDTANIVIFGAPTMEKMAKLCRRGFKCFHFLPTRTSHTTGPSRFRATSHYKKCYSAGKLMWQRARDIHSWVERDENWTISMTSVIKKKRHGTHDLAKIMLQLIISVLFHLFTSKMCIQRFVQFDRSTISPLMISLVHV